MLRTGLTAKHLRLNHEETAISLLTAFEQKPARRDCSLLLVTRKEFILTNSTTNYTKEKQVTQKETDVNRTSVTTQLRQREQQQRLKGVKTRSLEREGQA
jgi:hypothetical protein